MVTADHKFNLAGCEKKVREILAKQDRILLIINTPAHNPTGFSLTPEEIENVVKMLEDVLAGTDKSAALCLDVAYIDYAGERVSNVCRLDMPKPIMRGLCSPMPSIRLK